MSQFPPIDKSQCTLLYSNFDCPWGGKQDIYLVPLSLLHLNADNGRVATWVSGHEANPDVKHFAEMTQAEWNATLIKFIQESSSKEDNKRTEDSLRKDGQLKVGAILTDGTVVAGNRRCSILMSLLRETGDYDKFGYFKCAIFDVPDTAEGKKQLKRLETKTQYGEDTPVAYGPIEKLVDIYNNVGVGRPYSASEYQNYLGLKKGQMENLIVRANILVDYLEYLGKPGNYEIARVEKLDGPINELALLHKKVSEREWERIKVSFYKTLNNLGKDGKKGDRTRIIRAQIRVYFENREKFERDLAEQDDDLLNGDAKALGLSSTSVPATSQSREDMFVETALGIQKDAARTKPISYITNAIDELSKLDKTAVTIMRPEEKADFFRKVDALIRRAQAFTKDKFE